MERQINRLSRLKFYSKLPDEFIPAKTLKEANAYAEKYFNLRCSYKGIDVRIANEWNRGVYDMKKEFPEVADKLKFIGTGQERNRLIKKEIEAWVEDNYRPMSYHPDNIKREKRRKVNELAKHIGAGKIEDYTNAFSTANTETFKFYNDAMKEIYHRYVGVVINKTVATDYEVLVEELREAEKRKWSPQVGREYVRYLFDHEFGHQIDHYCGISEVKEVKNIRFSHTNEELTEKLCTYAWNNKNSNPCGEMIAEA